MAHPCEEFGLTPSEWAKFIINDLKGIARKTGLPITDFPAELCLSLLSLRKMGKANNAWIKSILMEHAEWVRAGRPPEEEEPPRGAL